MSGLIRTSLAMAVLAAIPAAIPAAHAQDVSTPFMRSRTVDGLTTFETATRTYRRADGTGSSVSLVGVVHIGDKGYYGSLVELLDGHDVVLYESVLPRGAFGTGGDTDLGRQRSTQDAMLFVRGLVEGYIRANGRAPVDRTELRAFVVGRDTRLARPFDLAMVDGWGRQVEYVANGDLNYALVSRGSDGHVGGDGLSLDLVLGPKSESMLASTPASTPETMAHVKIDVKTDAKKDERRDLYKELADALGVSLQVRSIDYDRPGWEPADLPMEELLDRLWKRGERSATLEMLSNDSGFQQGVVRFLLSMVSQSPGFKKLVIQALGQGGRQAERGLGDVDSRIIIDERNDAVIDALRTLLKREHPPASVAIFYGAAHMRDFEQTLREEFGLIPAEIRWDRAMWVDEWSAKRVEEQLARFRASRDAIMANDAAGSGPETVRIDRRIEDLQARLPREQ
ncbi:MAG: hypothetical protein ACKO3W_11215 [bacterium]